jgi:hypothetical protein
MYTYIRLCIGARLPPPAEIDLDQAIGVSLFPEFDYIRLRLQPRAAVRQPTSALSYMLHSPMAPSWVHDKQERAEHEAIEIEDQPINTGN